MLEMLEEARLLDNRDPLNHVKTQFDTPKNTIYLDGNSLGPLSYPVNLRVQEVMNEQWGQDLIKSWNQHNWIHKPQQVGDSIGKLIGAASGQTICCDSISVNLFKVLSVALNTHEGSTVLSTKDNFPTDLYMVQGLKALFSARNIELKLVAEKQLEKHIDEDIAVVMVSQVNFRSGALLDIPKLTKRAHENNAAIIVDVAHSAGALPVHLDRWKVDFAVGCTYKYLNAGPGAPAFLYVAKRHLGASAQPLYGWMGHAEPFEFSPDYQPAADITQYLTGTPPIISMAATEAAVSIFESVSIDEIRDKSIKLGLAFERAMETSGLDQRFQSISPSSPKQRGSQLSYEHPEAFAICQAWIAEGVIADFRAPNYLRIGFAPLYLSFEDIFHAVEKLEKIMRTKAYNAPKFQAKNKVT